MYIVTYNSFKLYSLQLKVICTVLPVCFSYHRDYTVNDLVKIKITALEATGHFLGQSKRITMCEADAVLEGKLETVSDIGQVCHDKTDSDGYNQAASS